ncbi:MAG: hypothetical protein AAF714_11390 [Pseudomonadota bacterium]
MSFVPETYKDWKICIVEKCGIPLTPDYVEERLAALSDDGDYQTQKFIERWGARHHARTMEWFERAKAELASA